MSGNGDTQGIWTAEGLAAAKLALARVGHDFGNLLTPLMAYPGLIRDDVAPDSKGAELLDAIEQTADDMVRITRQMLQLSLADDFSPRPFDLNDVLDVAVESVRSTHGEGMQAEIALGGGVDAIEGGQDQVGQAVSRLCSNGFEAMGEGGVLSVSAERIELDEPRTLSTGSVPAGTYAIVRVTDAGKCIDADSLGRVFEPFFTTKRDRAKRGAGLGLTYAYLVAAAHGGGIDIESTSCPGGTTVVLYLCISPLGKAEEGAADEEPVASGEMVPCEENHILVVDDEDSVRDSFAHILSVSLPDVTVTTVSDGAQALSAFSQGHHAVILMDIHMPKLDGFAAFSEIESVCRERNWVRPSVIFCTGFAPAEMVRRAVEGQSQHMLLMKPIRGQTLVDAVRARILP